MTTEPRRRVRLLRRIPSFRDGRRCGRLAIVWTLWVPALCGCPRPDVRPFLPDPIPMAEAVAVLNTNLEGLRGTLKASGPVDGQFIDANGRTRRYHVDGFLLYRAPRYVRFDLKSFGERQFLLGSNLEEYWVFSRQDDRYFCGRHGDEDDAPIAMPVRPDQLVDALGLTPVVLDDLMSGAARVQRVVEDYQQILFVDPGDGGRARVTKEYWLDRRRPRLIRRVIFRDDQGVVTMQSTLDDYRPLTAGGPQLPHRMSAEWPKKGAAIRFRVGRWRLLEGVGPGSVQFALPRACLNP